MSSVSIPRLVVPEFVVTESERLLQGSPRHETLVYWAGISAADVGVVTSVLLPQQETTRGSFEVSRRANADVAVWLCQHKLKLLAQLHTHPGAFVGHSEGDDLGAPLAFEGYYSLVIPNYARNGIRPLAKCGVHVFAGRFLELSPQFAATQVLFVPHVADFLT